MKIQTKIKTPVLALFIVIFFAIPSQTKSESTIIISERIPKSELQSGYAIASANKDAIVAIKPNTLNRSAFVEFIKPDFYPSAPLDKDLVSKIYHYAILPATNNQLPSTINIQMTYPKAENRYKEIYIYNQEISGWQHVPGTINTEKNTLTAKTFFASGFIAVFADHLERSEYLKKKINSESILIADAKTGEILVERLSDYQRPIASLTKLMTAAVFLDHNPGWDKTVSMTSADDTIPAKIYVRTGDKLTTRALFNATLLKSANNAAKALARSTGLTHQQFVDKMNKKAKLFGMTGTHFEEVTGLSKENVSTAQDLMILSKKMFSSMTFLRATTPKYLTIATSRGKRITMKNSNKLMDVPYIVLGSKTGFTYEAGRCLDMKVKNKQGREIIAITLGANEFGAHWDDMRTLLDAALGE